MQRISYTKILSEMDPDWEQKFLDRPLVAMSQLEVFERLLAKTAVDTLPVPWKGMTEKFGGIRLGELTIVTAESGRGKTTWCLNLIYHLTRFTPEPVMVFSLEMGAEAAIKKIFRMKTGENVKSNSPSHITEYRTWAQQTKLLILDHDGYLRFDMLKIAIAWAAGHHNCKTILVDHFHSTITAASKAYEIEIMAQELRSLAHRLGIAIIVICHPRQLAEGTTEADVGMNNLKGSSGLKQYADNVISLYYNIEEKYTRVRFDKIRDDDYGQNLMSEIYLKLGPNLVFMEVQKQ